MHSLTEEIQQLKQEKRAVILAHYYVPEEVQAVADAIGDSFYLSKMAATTQAEVLIFAGVSFMGESAKILNPDKRYFCPTPTQTVPWPIWHGRSTLTLCGHNIPTWPWSVTSIPLPVSNV